MFDEINEENVDHIPVRGTRTLQDIYSICYLAVIDPANVEEAMDLDVWRLAMQEELEMIDKNSTWELTEKPVDRKTIGVKWIFKTKLNNDGSISKQKARLVVKGYAQSAGIDYKDTFALVARLDTIRLLIAITAQNGWFLYQLDVKSAFLNGFLEEETYVDQPEGFVIEGKEDHVYRLKKALYGLKQAPRAWYNRLDDHLIKLGFEKSETEVTLYIKQSGSDFIILSVYVDDLLILGNCKKLIEEFKTDMKNTFEMNDLGLLTYFLGLEIYQTSAGIMVSQKKFALDVLLEFSMDKCKAVKTPLVVGQKFQREDGSSNVDGSIFRSIIGSLLYLSASRQDIMFAVSLMSRFMQNPSEIHMKAVKRILRFIKGTADYGIVYANTNSVKPSGYSDSDWAESDEGMKSTTSYCFSIGSGVISWCSKKQLVVAQSTAEAKYVAASKGANQAIWLRKVLSDLKMPPTEPTMLFMDNKAAIAIVKNSVLHDKTKHFKIKLHVIQHYEEKKMIQVEYC